MAVLAVAGCGQQAQSSPAGGGSGLVRARYTLTTEEGEVDRVELEVIADGSRRIRVTQVGPQQDQRTGAWTVWDGRFLLSYDPSNEPKYTRTENVEADQRPAFILPEGSAEFARTCPGARRLGTHTVLGRAAVRYACAASAGQDTAPKPQEMSLDEATRLVLRQSGAGSTAEATEFELNPAVDADTFSTDLPAATADDPAGPKIEDFRLPQIGGGELSLADYPKPLVIVTGSAAGIRKVLSRLSPLTHGGVKPQIIGMLIAVPSADWKGSLLNPDDAASFARETAAKAGTFPVPVAIDIKGAAGYQITQAAGIEAGQTKRTAIGFITSNGTLAEATTDTATDEELHDQIAALR